MTTKERTAQPFKGVLVRTDGSSEVIERPAGTDTLRWLYDQIGCSTVDVVRLHSRLDMWLDDEGMIVAEPRLNLHATAICGLFGSMRQLLYGNAVLLGGADRHGNTLPLKQELIDGLMERLDVK